MDDLLRIIAENIPEPAVRVDVVVPYTRGDLVSEAHSRGTVLEEEHLGDGTRLVAFVEGALAARLIAADASARAGADSAPAGTAVA